MTMQPVLQSKSSSDLSPHIKSHPESTLNTGFNKEARSFGRPSLDRLVYLTACNIGHLVEVHLKNGSVYSGIFHAADVEKDFDSIFRGHRSRTEFVTKPPSKTFIIPADEIVQVVAKDLSIYSDGMLNAAQSEKPQSEKPQSEKPVELLTDSSIAQSCNVDLGRELKPWVPDENVPGGPDLENVFDDQKNRGWDQFDVNESQFGVKSTFNEEVYTTKLEKGHGTRELEEQALMIAREIEGENTRDLHVAEERGHQLSEKFDIDEETKYSSVLPVDGFDDSGFNEEDDMKLDTCNDLTFGDFSTSDGQKPASSIDQKPTSSSGQKPTSYFGKGYEELKLPFIFSKGDTHTSRIFAVPDSSISESQLGEPDVSHSNRSAEESVAGDGGGQVSGETKSESSLDQSASTSRGPEVSEKTALNPNAKVFKLNPNADSLETSEAGGSARPENPRSEESFYCPVQQMPPAGYQLHYPGQMMYYYPPYYYHQTYYAPYGQPPQYYQQQYQEMIPDQPMPPVYMPPPPPPPPPPRPRPRPSPPPPPPPHYRPPPPPPHYRPPPPPPHYRPPPPPPHYRPRNRYNRRGC